MPLSLDEQLESQNYKEIYYTGNNNVNKTGDTDEDNRYLCYINDQIYFRYQILEECGRGSFSNVLQVIDHKIGKKRILKIIRKEPRFIKQAKIENNILTLINNEIPHQTRILKLLKCVCFRCSKLLLSDEDLLKGKDIYESFDLIHERSKKVKVCGGVNGCGAIQPTRNS